MGPKCGATGFLATLAALPTTLVAQSKPVRIELLTTIRPDGGTTHAAAFSPDGTSLATGGETGDLRVLEIATKRIRWTQQPSYHWIGVVAFSPDGSRLACRGRHLTIHDAATGAELVRVPDVGPQGFAWHRDGKRYAYGAGRQLVLRAGDESTIRAEFEYPINAVAFGEGDDLYVGDNVSRIWRVRAGSSAAELVRDHRTPERDMVRCIDVAFANGVLFDIASEGPVHRNDARLDAPAKPFAFAVTNDGQSFAVGGCALSTGRYSELDPTTIRWWTDGGATFTDLTAPGSVAALAFHPDGKRLFVSTYCEAYQALHERGREPVPLPGHSAVVSRLAMTPDGRTLAIRGKTWSLHPLDGRPSRPLPGILGVEAGRSGGEFIVQEEQRAVVLDTLTGKEVAAVPATGCFLGSTAQPGPGNLLLAGDNLVDRSGGLVTALPKLITVDSELCTATSSTGAWAIACADNDDFQCGNLWLTDADGKNPREVDACPVFTVAFSVDGKRLYYGCGPGMLGPTGPPNHALRVRDVASLALVAQVDAVIHEWRFLDARRALVSNWGKLQVWDVQRLQPIQDLPIGCWSFALSDDRRTLAIASSRGVDVYRVTID